MRPDSIKQRLFLVGCPRSGTTLLQSMIAAHPRVASFPESHFFFGLQPTNRTPRGWVWADRHIRSKFADALERLGRPDLRARLPAWRPTLGHHVRAFVSILDELALQEGADCWLEKTPDHVFYIDLIRHFIPDARFIHLVRHGRDVVASLYEVSHQHPEHWSGEGWSVEGCLAKWKKSIGQTQLHARLPGHVVVRYEDLVADAEAVMKETCALFGLDFDPAMLVRPDGPSELVAEFEVWKQGVDGAIRKGSSGKFDRVFDDTQKARIAAEVEDLDEVLPVDLFPTARHLEAFDAPRQRPRILVLGPTRPTSNPISGTDQRLAVLMRGLQAVGDVRFVQVTPWSSRRIALYCPDTRSPGDACVAAAHCRNLRRHRPDPWCVRELNRAHPEIYDLVFVHRLAASWWTGWTDPKRTILDLDDVPSQVFGGRARRGVAILRALKWLRYFRIRWSERHILDAFRFVLVCSEDDRRYLGNHPHVAVVANTYWPRPLMQQDPSLVEEPTMLFVGTLKYLPNVRGLAWFVHEVLPLIRRRLVDARLTVIGRTPEVMTNEADWSWRGQPGVQFVGAVEDVAPFIRAASITVCPVLEGGGTRIKILESLAFGRAVVSTSPGAYGMTMSDREGLIRRDGPEAFAEGCIELLSEPRKAHVAALAGRQLVQQHFHPRVAEQRLRELVLQTLAEGE